MSQPPERRRRARLAAKTKRLYLTLGGDKALLEMEYNTGSAWIEGHKVCSATASRPPRAEEAGPGWVNTPLIAKLAKVTQDALEKTWSPLKAEIN